MPLSLRYALLALVFLCAIESPPARADQLKLAGGLGAIVARPLSSDVTDVYTLGVGIAADLQLVYNRNLRMSLSLGPNYASGTPVAGALASNESGTRLQLPMLATLIYTVSSRGSVTPYGGLGLGLLYTREKLNFDSPLGPRERSKSATELAWSAVLGVEQNKPFRLFAEGWFVGSGTGGVAGQEGSGTTLNALQLRLGIRGQLK